MIVVQIVIHENCKRIVQGSSTKTTVVDASSIDELR